MCLCPRSVRSPRRRGTPELHRHPGHLTKSQLEGAAGEKRPPHRWPLNVAWQTWHLCFSPLTPPHPPPPHHSLLSSRLSHLLGGVQQNQHTGDPLFAQLHAGVQSDRAHRPHHLHHPGGGHDLQGPGSAFRLHYFLRGAARSDKAPHLIGVFLQVLGGFIFPSPLPELPGPPTNLAISNIGPRSVTLQFKPGYDGKTSISRWDVEAQARRPAPVEARTDLSRRLRAAAREARSRVLLLTWCRCVPDRRDRRE